MKEYISVKEAIEIYGKSDSTIRRLLRHMTENDKDKYIIQSGNKNLISSIYLDTEFRPRKAVLQDQSNEIIRLVNVTDRIVAMNELMTDNDSPINRAIKAIELSANKYDNMTDTMLKYIEQQKVVIESQNKIIDRLMTDSNIEEVKPPKKKKKKKSKSKKKKKGKKSSK